MANKLPNYPPDHQVGMIVPKGGSSCAKCKYVQWPYCKEEKFIEWNGSNKIPAKAADEYCCDFFEAKENDNTRSPHGFPSLKSLRSEAHAEGESVEHEREEYREGKS